MARPVAYNVNEKPLVQDISVGEMPEGYQGEGFFASKLSDVVGLARKNSIWPLPFATSCCGIEFMATMASHYDLARFGSERVGFSPRQCGSRDRNRSSTPARRCAWDTPQWDPGGEHRRSARGHFWRSRRDVPSCK